MIITPQAVIVIAIFIVLIIMAARVKGLGKAGFLFTYWIIAVLLIFERSVLFALSMAFRCICWMDLLLISTGRASYRMSMRLVMFVLQIVTCFSSVQSFPSAFISCSSFEQLPVLVTTVQSFPAMIDKASVVKIDQSQLASIIKCPVHAIFILLQCQLLPLTLLTPVQPQHPTQQHLITPEPVSFTVVLPQHQHHQEFAVIDARVICLVGSFSRVLVPVTVSQPRCQWDSVVIVGAVTKAVIMPFLAIPHYHPSPPTPPPPHPPASTSPSPPPPPPPPAPAPPDSSSTCSSTVSNSTYSPNLNTRQMVYYINTIMGCQDSSCKVCNITTTMLIIITKD